MSLLPAGPLAAGLFSAWLGPIVGRRGLLALKLRQVGFINQLCRSEKSPDQRNCIIPFRDAQRAASPLWVTGGKTPSEYMLSELPQLADIVGRVRRYSASPLVLRITAFWVRAIPR